MHGRHQTACVRIVIRDSGFGIRDSGFGIRGSGFRIRGEVACSLVGRNYGLTAMPTAAARCMAPESLVTSARLLARTPASVGRSVRPTRLTIEREDVAERSTSCAAPASGCTDHHALHAV